MNKPSLEFGRPDSILIRLSEIDLSSIPFAKFDWFVNRRSVPMICSGFYISRVADFFDSLYRMIWHRARDGEFELVFINEFRDDFDIFVKRLFDEQDRFELTISVRGTAFSETIKTDVEFLKELSVSLKSLFEVMLDLRLRIVQENPGCFPPVDYA